MNINCFQSLPSHKYREVLHFCFGRIQIVMSGWAFAAKGDKRSSNNVNFFKGKEIKILY